MERKRLVVRCVLRSDDLLIEVQSESPLSQQNASTVYYATLRRGRRLSMFTISTGLCVLPCFCYDVSVCKWDHSL